MIDRAKVLKGLECCADRTGKLCRHCPYDFTKSYCVTDMATDALELLKYQQETITSLQGTIHKLNAALTEQPEQKHGHWIPIKSETGVEYGGFKQYAVYDVKCSACGFADDVSTCVYTYCPNCGAKMDEEVKDDA